MTTNSYSQRVNRVMDHIRGHLAEDLSLHELAKVAYFSPYHFHRIFKATTGETVAAFTRRARLERAVFLMRATPTRALGSIAAEVGFGTQADFSRVFRSHFEMAPSVWDRKSRLDGKDDFVDEARRQGAMDPLRADVVNHEACRVAYVRVRDPWRHDSLTHGYERLTAWLRERGVDWRASKLLGMSWDSEKATPIEKLTYDLGLTVGSSIDAQGDFGIHEFPAVRAVEVHCQGLPSIAVAWEYLYAVWLPNSRYEPDDAPALKRFRTTPETFDRDAWNVDCSIALRPQMP